MQFQWSIDSAWHLVKRRVNATPIPYHASMYVQASKSIHHFLESCHPSQPCGFSGSYIGIWNEKRCTPPSRNAWGLQDCSLDGEVGVWDPDLGFDNDDELWVDREILYNGTVLFLFSGGYGWSWQIRAARIDRRLVNCHWIFYCTQRSRAETREQDSPSSTLDVFKIKSIGAERSIE